MRLIKKGLVNKASLLGSALVALLIITSCSDSGTSTTGVNPMSREAAESGDLDQTTLKKEGDHGHHVGADSGHSHTLDQQHAEPPEVTTSSVLALSVNQTPVCGNFILEAGEECDDGLAGSATCFSDCTLKRGREGIPLAKNYCGDGTKDANEECDDGNDGNEDSCTQYCKIAVCGDGYTQPSNGERCDDKNRVNTDSCNNECQINAVTKATTVVTTTTVTTVTNNDGGTTTVVTPKNELAFCGNNIVEAGEECDDGNTVAGDGCSSSCQAEPPATPPLVVVDTRINDISTEDANNLADCLDELRNRHDVNVNHCVSSRTTCFDKIVKIGAEHMLCRHAGGCWLGCMDQYDSCLGNMPFMGAGTAFHSPSAIAWCEKNMRGNL